MTCSPLRAVILVFVAAAAGCAQQSTRPGPATPVEAASASAQAARQAMSPMLLALGREFVIRPMFVFCRGHFPYSHGAACPYHPSRGYRRVFFFCQGKRRVDSAGPSAHCADAAYVKSTLQPFLLWASNRGYWPKFLNCRGSGANWTCHQRPESGYRRMLMFCRTYRPINSFVRVTDCIDATHVLGKVDAMREQANFPANTNG